jgi:aminoglycoside phosphotransferase
VGDIHRDPAQDFNSPGAHSKRFVNIAGNQLRLLHEQVSPANPFRCKSGWQKAAVEASGRRSAIFGNAGSTAPRRQTTRTTFQEKAAVEKPFAAALAKISAFVRYAIPND